MARAEGPALTDRWLVAAVVGAVGCVVGHALAGTSVGGRAVVDGAAVALVVTAMIPRSSAAGLEGTRWITAGLAVLALVGAETGFAAALAVAPFLYGGWWIGTAASGDDGRFGRTAEPDPVERPMVAFVAGLVALGLGLAWLIASPVAWIAYTTGPSDARALLWPWTAIPGAAAVAMGAGAVRAVRRLRHPGS